MWSMTKWLSKLRAECRLTEKTTLVSGCCRTSTSVSPRLLFSFSSGTEISDHVGSNGGRPADPEFKSSKLRFNLEERGGGSWVSAHHGPGGGPQAEPLVQQGNIKGVMLTNLNHSYKYIQISFGFNYN